MPMYSIVKRGKRKTSPVRNVTFLLNGTARGAAATARMLRARIAARLRIARCYPQETAANTRGGLHENETLLCDHQLHAPVLLPSGRGFVRRNRRFLTLSIRGDVIARDAGGDEIVANRVCALLRQRLIHGRPADVVGVTFDRDLQRWIGLQLFGDLRQRRFRSGLQRGLAGVEEDSAVERDDESALLAARRCDARELVLNSQPPRLGVALRELAPRFFELRLRRLRGSLRLLRRDVCGLRLLRCVLGLLPQRRGLGIRLLTACLPRRDRVLLLLLALRTRGGFGFQRLPQRVELLLTREDVSLTLREHLR